MTRKLDFNQFVIKANYIHNFKYNYSKVNYTNAFTNIIIICPIHGEFLINPNNHLYNKRGCQECSRFLLSQQNILTISQFIEKANIIHNFKYDYSESNYISAKDKLKIICPVHNGFHQKASDHLYGKGCPECKRDFLSISRISNINDFVKKANVTHNFKYDYSKSIYISSSDLIEIICYTHSSFWQNANSHLNGSGCKKCKSFYKETKWLNSCNVAENNRQIRINVNNRYFVADGFDPVTNTVYEFYGDFWHGNPKIYSRNDINSISKKTFGELYDNTLKKEKVLIDNKFKIITMWEHDWNIQ